MTIRVGVDTGGTFTDFVVVEDGRVFCFKVLSTPREPESALLGGAARLGRVRELLHGTTVATNALLERRGARTGIVTTRGFEDLIVIGRQTRPSLYELEAEPSRPLVPESLRLSVRERTHPKGRVLEGPARADLERCARELRRRGARSVAVCFLHAYASDRNERTAARILRRTVPHVCTSAGVLPEHREFERFSTAVLSAYLTPILADYLRAIGRRSRAGTLRVLRSDGTMLGARAASREAAHSLLSGPAGGVVACVELGRRLRRPRLLSLDMGGTSTDVCLVEGGHPPLKRRWQVGGLPVALPSLAIETVGAGGGSVARADEGGALRVGPESAGADPGPVCWGRGEQLTVTDANLYLGRLDPAALERHGVRILPERVAVRMSALSRRLGISPTRAAEGILGVAEAAMERALRRISVEQGHDPRQFSLVAFGGAGGLHAVSLARRLGCREILVPPSPGTFSALGLLLSPLCVERTATVLGRVRGPRQAAAILARLEREARRLLAAERRTGPARIERWADLRYRGQAHELSVPFGERAERAFHLLHARRFGISDARQPVEWVALRVRIRAAAPPLRTLQPVVRQFRREKSAAAPMEESAVPGAAGGDTAVQSRRASACWDGSWRPTLVVPRPALRRGRSLSGPALIVDYSGTTALPPGARARHGPHGVLLVKP